MSKIENSFNQLGIKDIHLKEDAYRGAKDALAFDHQRVNLNIACGNQAYFPLTAIATGSAFEALAKLEVDKINQLAGKSEEYSSSFKKVDAWFKEGKRLRKRLFLDVLLNIKSEEDLMTGIRRR